MSTTSADATTYDFQNPGHKLNTTWPVLDLVGSGIGVAVAAALSAKLQLSLRGESLSVQRVPYAQCLASLEKTCVVYEISIAPLPGMAWFCMDTSVISAIVELYFGGNGKVVPIDEPRALSHTEARVVKHILDALLLGVNKGWNIVLKVEAASSRRLPVNRLANVLRQPVMVVNEMMLRLRDVELPYSLIYPYEMLVPISEQLQHEPEKTRREDSEFSRAMRRELMNCELDIRGVLVETQITLGKLLELKAGDFIPLRDVQNVSFKTNNMPLFDARIGSSNGRVSASLSRWHLPLAS